MTVVGDEARTRILQHNTHNTQSQHLHTAVKLTLFAASKVLMLSGNTQTRVLRQSLHSRAVLLYFLALAYYGKVSLHMCTSLLDCSLVLDHSFSRGNIGKHTGCALSLFLLPMFSIYISLFFNMVLLKNI